MRRLKAWATMSVAAILLGCASQGTTPGTEPSSQPPPAEYEQRDISRAAEGFFGAGAEGLADILNRIFSQEGRPNGYIEGEEGGGAVGVGVRYGSGVLHLKDGTKTKVYWRGPSLGLDIGGNAAKAFVLVYDLPNVETLYQRFPGVDGSVYFVGGVGMNYNRSGDVTLAPIRFGVGWRQGVNVGYIHLSSKRSWIPF